MLKHIVDNAVVNWSIFLKVNSIANAQKKTIADEWILVYHFERWPIATNKFNLHCKVWNENSTRNI